MKVYTTIFLACTLAAMFSNKSNSISERRIIPCGVTVTDTVNPPVIVRTTFTRTYPSAQRVVWYQYRPVKNPEPNMWYSKMGDDDYYVTFLMNDNDYTAWYDNNGTMVYSVSKMDNIELPAAVQTAINNQYAGYYIRDVDLETDNNMTVYEVKMEKGNDIWNVRFRPDGTVYKKKQRMMKVAGDPAFVSDFKARYPTASNVAWYNYDASEMYEVSPTDWNFGMADDDYEVRFSMNGNDYVAYYDNGKWVRSDIRYRDGSSLPTGVSSSITTEYAGYTVDDVNREEMMNGTVYEVQIKKGNQRCKIHYKEDGTIVKRKCSN